MLFRISVVKRNTLHDLNVQLESEQTMSPKKELTLDELLKRRTKLGPKKTRHVPIERSNEIYLLSVFFNGLYGNPPPHPKALNTRRWRVYEKNVTCVYCGLAGTHAVVWRDYNWVNDQYHDHYDLINVDEQGIRTLMTLDHFIPKSKGGPDNLENLVVACSPCNFVKEDKFMVDFTPPTFL